MTKNNGLTEKTAQRFALKKLLRRKAILRKLILCRLAVKKLISASIVLLMLTGCQIGQLTTFYTDDTSVEEDGIRYDAGHQPITGVYHKYTDKMQLIEEAHYVNGKINGAYKEYQDGLKTLTASYKDGKPFGKMTAYYPNGKEKEILYYDKNGEQTGSYLAYYENGSLMAKGSYLNGKKNGVFEEYFTNGAVKSSVHYLNGKLHGPSRFYTPENHLIQYTEYVDGLRNGPAFSYYKNEKPKVFGYRKDDKLDGIAKEFDADGNLKALVTYKDNQEIKRVQF